MISPENLKEGCHMSWSWEEWWRVTIDTWFKLLTSF